MTLANDRGATTGVNPTPDQAAASGKNTDWWRDAVVYQIYPRSFADANADGMGDLPGVTRRLDYLAHLGIDAVWLSPFYKSPQADAGYDVADYRQVDEIFGTLEDFDALASKATELGIKVIVDLVPNHTSDDHEWFQQALKDGPGSAARERYIFREGRGPDGSQPPNNWDSIFGGPAWTRVSELPVQRRAGASDDQWYLHLFDSRQPDLNWENPQVRAELIDILKFWAERGVSGFRVDVAHGLVKAPGLPDWDGKVVMAEGTHQAPDGPTANNPVPMFDQDGVHEIYRSWRAALDEVDPQIALIAEAWVEPLSRMALYVRPDEMQQAFNFSYLTAPWDAEGARKVITESLTEMSAVGAPTTWVLSNHDVVRHATRLAIAEDGRGPNGIRAQDPQPDAAKGLRRALAATVQMLALPGSAYLYQGEELGLPEHTTMPDEYRQDPAWERTNHAEAGRDGCRVPLPWNAGEPGYGFSFGADAAGWLPQPETYRALAADQQVGVAGSTFELYRRALQLRRELDLGNGELHWRNDLMAAHPQLLAFENHRPGRPAVLVLMNYGDAPLNIDLGSVGVGVPPTIRLSSQEITAGDPLHLPAESSVWLQP